MENNKIFLLSGILAFLLVLVKVNGNNYYVYFDTNGRSKIEAKQVKKGDKIDKPKNPKKEGYIFLEWKLDGKPYNFSNKITKDITLVASWKKEEIKNDKLINNNVVDDSEIEQNNLKVGDKVLIIGEYAISYDGELTGYNKAIGWEREILAIYDGEDYPYQVGNTEGTTGFFKILSLEKIN